MDHKLKNQNMTAEKAPDEKKVKFDFKEMLKKPAEMLILSEILRPIDK